MTPPRITLLALSAAAALPLIAGCLERKEKIRVHRDGRVEMTMQISGDAADFQAGDSVPSARTGWDVKTQFKEENGKRKVEAEARLDLKPGQPLPDSFADRRDPNYDIALRFPTSLTIEQRPDGTYYSFKRVYKARANARFAYFMEQMQETEPFKSLKGKDPSEITDEERVALLRGLQQVEGHKRAQFLEIAFETVAPTLPQDYFLRARRALLDHFERADIEPLVGLLREPESTERDDLVNQFGEHLVARAETVVRDELAALRVPRGQIDQLLSAYQHEAARRAITDDLGDELWELSVRLPGTLVAHNADRVEEGAVLWGFHGKALMDRDQVCMVTTRVGRDDAGHDDATDR